MLLSKVGSVGLDLSFVTHIFFLGKYNTQRWILYCNRARGLTIRFHCSIADSIFDKSLESQVVARAYRMGATGPVYVEELVAKQSIEEVMNQMVSGEDANEVDTEDLNETRAKVHQLLKSAKLIREHPIGNKKRKLTENEPPNRARVGVRFQE
jgi:hypothetical protein